jgi:hypothetical protein
MGRWGGVAVAEPIAFTVGSAYTDLARKPIQRIRPEIFRDLPRDVAMQSRFSD